ncbi:MAG: chemotaxis protein CheA [Lachnospiraceae bacterium]
MDKEFSTEPMLEVFIYETSQNIEQLEKLILESEKANHFEQAAVNEIFRIMHTIKGSSAMMLYNNIASVSHAMEDLFFYIREENPKELDCSILSDLLFEGVDFIKLEMEKVKNADNVDGDPEALIGHIKCFLVELKEENGTKEAKKPDISAKEPADAQQYYLPPVRNSTGGDKKTYEAVIFFEAGCEMENIRAFAIIHNLKDITEEFAYFPEDIIDHADSIRVIRESGFRIVLRVDQTLQELHEYLSKTAFVREIELTEVTEEKFVREQKAKVQECQVIVPRLASEHEQLEQIQSECKSSHQSMISVDVGKLDKLMDLMGEMVIAEAMVTQNPDLQDLPLVNFYKSARQLKKITGEMQDMVMSIRMVPLSGSFRKMFRIVRDMNRRLDKEAELTLLGEGTEVDKNIIEHISDPLMHLVRNSVDHGIESTAERVAAGKPRAGRIVLEAKNAGSDVLIIVSDDGAGINKEKVLQRAMDHGMLNKQEGELSDREIYNLIFLPGFSTNDNVTEFSGRGVGMDVVVKNLETIGGSVSVDSVEGTGTVTTLKIPLTLAIIDGMNIRVGAAKYTLPTTSIRETFRAEAPNLIRDPEGNEMIMVRGECYPIVRLHELFAVESDTTDLTQGVMLMIEQDEKSIILFADELLGQNQVVVKALPSYMKNIRRVEELAGCTLLGDGSISLILNVGGLLNVKN